MLRGSADGNAPDLEIVGVPSQCSFEVWAHGYPFRTVRWHFHPEYEIHLVTETTGRAFVGDYIGTFAPGNLVLTGPNLPHNWISDVAAGETVGQRGLVVQFTAEFITRATGIMPELRAIDPMLARSAAGLEFAEGTGALARPVIEAMIEAEGPARIGHFFALLSLLAGSDYHRLASENYRARPEHYADQPLNLVLDHIAKNAFGNLRQSVLAQLSGFSPSGFSRAFRQHTGVTFVRYVNETRINHACEMLMSGNQRVTEICFALGFNNLSNFNRHFIGVKGRAPSEFRRRHRENAATRFAEAARPEAAAAPIL